MFLALFYATRLFRAGRKNIAAIWPQRFLLPLKESEYKKQREEHSAMRSCKKRNKLAVGMVKSS